MAIVIFAATHSTASWYFAVPVVALGVGATIMRRRSGGGARGPFGGGGGSGGSGPGF